MEIKEMPKINVTFDYSFAVPFIVETGEVLNEPLILRFFEKKGKVGNLIINPNGLSMPLPIFTRVVYDLFKGRLSVDLPKPTYINLCRNLSYDYTTHIKIIDPYDDIYMVLYQVRHMLYDKLFIKT